MKGLGSALGKIAAIRRALDAETNKALFVCGLAVEENAKTSIQAGGKTGVVYRKGKKKNILHRASAPGEAPATDTGRLVNSIRTTAKNGGKTVEIIAGSGVVEYASALEFGTSNVAARPFMQPALDKAKPEIRRIMRRKVKDATIKITKS